MDHSTSDADKAKFPGVFVRHKGHKEPATMTHLQKQLEHLGPGTVKSDTEMDSPHSVESEAEEFAISSCTSSCSVTTSSAKGLAPPCNNGLSSECGMTISDSEAISSTEGLDGNRSDAAKVRRSKRKKSKDKNSEDNNALDPVRYKTKMCKNWQQLEKCPYGPRCLFAHGTKEMRTYSLNSNAISTACNSSSPERQFYNLGHFPNFMPVPFNNPELEDGNPVVKEEVETDTSTTNPKPTNDPSTGQYTHSPYSPCAPPCVLEPQPQYPTVETRQPSALGHMQEYYYPHRAYHTQIPMFPQLPYPPECAMYGAQYASMSPYPMTPEMYSMPYYPQVR